MSKDERQTVGIFGAVAQLIRVRLEIEEERRQSGEVDVFVPRAADDRQVAAALPDNLMPGRERDQVRESLQSHHRAIADVLLNRFLERDYLSQASIYRRLTS